MRLMVEVRGQNEEELLRALAFESHRSVREQASYLLYLKLVEEGARRQLGGGAPGEPTAEVA